MAGIVASDMVVLWVVMDMVGGLLTAVMWCTPTSLNKGRGGDSNAAKEGSINGWW